MSRPSRRNAPSHAPVAAAKMLPAFLTIETADAVHAELQALLAETSGDVVLDASAVEVMTSPGLQLLVALGKSLGARGNALHLQHTPPSMAHILAEAGAEAFVNIASTATEA